MLASLAFGARVCVHVRLGLTPVLAILPPVLGLGLVRIRIRMRVLVREGLGTGQHQGRAIVGPTQRPGGAAPEGGLRQVLRRYYVRAVTDGSGRQR